MPFFSKPQLFIITGSNGAGKSTYRQALFPDEFKDLDIFDGDIFYSNKNTEYYKKTSIKRVEIRVRKNGFHVNPLDIQNNYYGNMDMLDKRFHMFNSIEILDTSSTILPVCSLRENEAFTPLSDENLPSWFKTYMPNIYALLSPR